MRFSSWLPRTICALPLECSFRTKSTTRTESGPRSTRSPTKTRRRPSKWLPSPSYPRRSSSWKSAPHSPCTSPTTSIGPSKSGATSGAARPPAFRVLPPAASVAPCIRALGFRSRVGRLARDAPPPRRCSSSATSLCSSPTTGGAVLMTGGAAASRRRVHDWRSRASPATGGAFAAPSALLGRSLFTPALSSDSSLSCSSCSPCLVASRGAHMLSPPGPVRTERLKVPCLRNVE
mmetsp:Transcript_27759/g.66093  ORF Transcript_27759/g.66093 Transcript_27759/m.66093 type:complete len:234 (+) Transcript_27759:1219-1920(+)